MEPAYFTSKGDFNVESWMAWYMQQNQVTLKQASQEYNRRIMNLPEPPVATGDNKPNPIWQKWYKLRKKVSSNIALNTCKQRIKALAEGKELPPEHRTVWW